MDENAKAAFIRQLCKGEGLERNVALGKVTNSDARQFGCPDVSSFTDLLEKSVKRLRDSVGIELEALAIECALGINRNVCGKSLTERRDELLFAHEAISKRTLMRKEEKGSGYVVEQMERLLSRSSA